MTSKRLRPVCTEKLLQFTMGSHFDLCDLAIALSAALFAPQLHAIRFSQGRNYVAVFAYSAFLRSRTSCALAFSPRSYGFGVDFKARRHARRTEGRNARFCVKWAVRWERQRGNRIDARHLESASSI